MELICPLLFLLGLVFAIVATAANLPEEREIRRQAIGLALICYTLLAVLNIFLALSEYCADRMAEADLAKNERDQKYWQERGERHLATYRKLINQKVLGSDVSNKKELDGAISPPIKPAEIDFPLPYSLVFWLAEKVWNEVYCSATEEEIKSGAKSNRKPWDQCYAQEAWMEVFMAYEKFRAKLVGDRSPDEEGTLSVGTWYQSATSGLYYRNVEAAGEISAILVNGKVFSPDTTPP